jgi:hypothetical protein
MKKDSITKMFEETFSTHFAHATWKTNNLHFDDVLDYLFRVTKSINTEKELIIFECEWLRIEMKIDGLFGSHHDNLHLKIAEINKHLVFLKRHPGKFINQKGFETFYEREYKNLFQKSLESKKIDEKSCIRSKKKHYTELNKFQIYFSIV